MAPPQVSSQVAPPSVSQLEFADVGPRLAAYLIDLLVCAVVFVAVVPAIRWIVSYGDWYLPAPIAPLDLWRATPVPGRLLTVLAYIVCFGPIYLGSLEASSWQASIGKRLLSIYVTDTGGRRLGLGKSLVRSFAKCILNAFYIGAVSIVTIPSTEQKEALHDRLVKTRVVRGRTASSSPPLGRILTAFGVQYLWLVGSYAATFRMVRLTD
jgi:uncharacterized RDD family membrane protein YckC